MFKYLMLCVVEKEVWGVGVSSLLVSLSTHLSRVLGFAKQKEANLVQTTLQLVSELTERKADTI
jgi:hypothetical protein